MPKKVILQKNKDYSSDDSETLTKPKVKKSEELKPKKKMTENQLNNLKKGHEVLQKNREAKKLNKKIEASKILLENNIDITTKKKVNKNVDSEDEKPTIKKKPTKKIIEESESEEDVIIVKKKKKPRQIIIEESDTDSDTDSIKTQPIEPKRRPLKSQENKKTSIKINNPLPNNFMNYF